MGLTNFEVFKNNTFEVSFQYKTRVSGTFVPVDLTGYTIQLKIELEDDNVFVKTNADSTVTITDLVNGKFKIFLTKADIDLMTVGNNKYEIAVIIGSSERTIINGMIEVIEWVKV